MVEEKAGGEEKHRAQIDGAQGQGVGVGPQQQRNGLGTEDAQQCQEDPQHQPGEQGQGKGAVGPGLIPLIPADGVAGGSADAQQDAQPVDKAENGNGQIEGRQAVRPQPVGYKEGVGHDVARQPQRAQHIERDVFKKGTYHVRSSQVWCANKKRA